jgi:predicted nuclease of predicted toxin-antitoxin system
MNPKLFADENVPIASVQALRQAGFDVLSASELEPGGADERVLERAVAANAILVTFDRAFRDCWVSCICVSAQHIHWNQPGCSSSC